MNIENSDIFEKNINLEDTIEFNVDDFDENLLDIKNIELENTLNLGGSEYGE